jgi:hypothetical protein
MGTVPVSSLNIPARVLMMASVRATLVAFECHFGNGNFSPELSKLREKRGRLFRADEVECDGHAPVLAPWGTVEINDELQAMIPSPSDGVEHVRHLSLDERFPRTDVERPIAYRKSYMVESEGGKKCECQPLHPSS